MKIENLLEITATKEEEIKKSFREVLKPILKNNCVICPIGSYIRSKFYDNEGNDAICNFCKEGE